MSTQGRRAADHALRLALVCGGTVESAAQKAGVSERTAYRRLKDPAFRQSVQASRTEMVQRAAAMLTAAIPEAVKTFLVLLQQPTTPAAVRLGAARAVVELGPKLREQADLEERVAELEKWISLRAPDTKA